MRRLVGRLQHFGTPLVLLLLGVVALFAGADTVELACDRATGTCTYRHGSLGGRASSTFPISAVREVRFVEKLGKHGRHARTVLVFASGADTSLGYGERDDAAERFEITRAFFRADGTAASYRYEATKGRWWWLVVAGCFVGALVLGVRAWQRPVVETMPTPARGVPAVEVAARASIRRRRLIRIGALVGGVVVLSVALMLIGGIGQGTLELRCETRCRFEQMECMPGAETSMGLDPGTYTIESWQASGSALWVPRTFTIAEGETTRFVCRP